jgi:hypothetical protein
VRAFFSAEGFSRETFLFYNASVLMRGSFGGVDSPLSFISLSSPPSSWFTSSPPPSAGESILLSSDALSSTSVSMSWTSSFFFFFFASLSPSYSVWVTKGIPMMSGSKISASSTSTKNYVGHSLVISIMSSSVNL